MVTYPDILDDEPPPPRRRRRWWRYIARHLPGFSVLLMMAMLAAIVLWPYMIINVPSGQVGVLWKRFNGFDMYCLCWVGRGTVLDPHEIREEGLHLIWPWDKLFLYDLRLQSSMQTYNAISSDGVNVKAQISVRYQLLHDSVGVLHKFIGPGYLASVLAPEIGSQARETISQFTAQQVYQSRDPIQKSIRDSAEKSLNENLDKLVQVEGLEQPDPKNYNHYLQKSIRILDTLVLGIELPPEIVAAINRQTEQYYMIQEFKFRVEREVEESKRKQIEADGIAAFQKTVSQGISESYLRWRGIEATIALSQSQNTKVVVIGSGKDGLPIILGNVDTPAAPPAAPQAGANATPAPPTSPTTPQSSTIGTTPSSGTLGNAPAATAKPPAGAPPAAAPSNGTGSGTTATPPPARGSPNGSAEPGPDATSTASAAANANEAQNVPSPIQIPQLNSILSRISGVIRSIQSDTGTGAKPGP
jgi:regulator of protease activity HflC (stomatin/prohibitin superfamily)